MKKKFAYIMMCGGHAPQTPDIVFETGQYVNHIFPVFDYEQAREAAARCAAEGFGVIELCGAFGPDRAREIIELTGGRVGVGYVTHFDDQNALFQTFFNGE